MRAQPGENKWANVDVSYTSSVWEQPVVASEVFIVPTVVSGQGTRQLLSIAYQGISDLSVQKRELAHEAKTVDHGRMAIKFAMVHEHRRRQKSQSSGSKELSAQIRTLRILKLFEFYAALVLQAHDLAEHLVGKFGQVQKVAQGVLAQQEGKGDELTQTSEGVQRLTISIKCVDAIWADIISTWTKFKKLRSEIEKVKVALPPIRQSLKAIGIDGGDTEDDDGEAAREDALDDSTSDGAAPVSCEAPLEHGLEEEQGGGSEPSSPKETPVTECRDREALTEKLAEKCEIRDVRQDAGKDGDGMGPRGSGGTSCQGADSGEDRQIPGSESVGQSS